MPLTELRSFNKIFIYWEEKIYESKVPIFNSSIRYDREADAYDCKLNFKKMKPINSESVIIYKEAKNQISYDIHGTFRYYYNGKEISEN
ncbi:MAG: hypothetical protein KBF93_02630 [Leptospiraceae bacterium]|nr:hypothetical protein [Leptospiraceae bacterium]